MTENFSKLLNSKLGDSKPLVEKTKKMRDISILITEQQLQDVIKSNNFKTI